MRIPAPPDRPRIRESPNIHPSTIRVGKADLTIKQDVRNLVGDDVEVKAERLIRTGLPIAANFNESVTRQGVVEARLDRQLKPVKVSSKMPRYLVTEISFPDVKDETYGSEQVSCLELRCSRCEVIKMSLRIRRSRGQDFTPPGRQQDICLSLWRGSNSVGCRFSDGINSVDPLVRWTRPNAAGRRRNIDCFGHSQNRQGNPAEDIV